VSRKKTWYTPIPLPLVTWAAFSESWKKTWYTPIPLPPVTWAAVSESYGEINK